MKAWAIMAACMAKMIFRFENRSAIAPA